MHMVPAIRNILGGFLFSGDDVYKRVRVLSGGERTRLAVARMLLRPSNTLLLDEPTNHLDLDSKEVLLDALVDYGGTLIFVSHDRYFVERLATKIIEVGRGTAIVYPGTYKEFLWHKAQQRADGRTAARSAGEPNAAGQQRAGGERGRVAARRRRRQCPASPGPARTSADSAQDEKKRASTPRRVGAQRAASGASARDRRRSKRRSPRCETPSASSRSTMSAPGFYEDRAASQPVIDRHQALMWKVGDLMHQWEELQCRHRPPGRLLTVLTESSGALQICYHGLRVSLVTD